MKGFSPRNLKYMRAFALAWPIREIVQTASAQLSWYHNTTLLEKVNVQIEKIESSGSIGKRNFKTIEAKSTDDANAKYYTLLYDCGGDKQVKSDIRDQYDSLKKAGHTKIICIRDVYPDATFNELPQLRAGLMHGLYQQDLPSVIFCLGVMEFEAWLLAENTHFTRFNNNITHEKRIYL